MVPTDANAWPKVLRRHDGVHFEARTPKYCLGSCVYQQIPNDKSALTSTLCLASCFVALFVYACVFVFCLVGQTCDMRTSELCMRQLPRSRKVQSSSHHRFPALFPCWPQHLPWSCLTALKHVQRTDSRRFLIIGHGVYDGMYLSCGLDNFPTEGRLAHTCPHRRLMSVESFESSLSPYLKGK